MLGPIASDTTRRAGARDDHSGDHLTIEKRRHARVGASLMRLTYTSYIEQRRHARLTQREP